MANVLAGLRRFGRSPGGEDRHGGAVFVQADRRHMAPGLGSIYARQTASTCADVQPFRHRRAFISIMIMQSPWSLQHNFLRTKKNYLEATTPTDQGM